MRVKPVTPLGLAFVFAGLLAGWASAANGLQASGHGRSGALGGSGQREGTALSALHHQTESTHQVDASGGASQHGGSVQRFHDSASCQLPAGVTLAGNWTHGDYVSAWAASGNPAAVQAAAHSPCGKPVKGAKDKVGKDAKHGKSKHSKESEHGKHKLGKHGHLD